MKTQIVAIFLALGLHGPAIAGFAEGAAAYREHDYASALQEIAPLARAGNADAQHLLGLMYFMGRGVPRDYRQAFEWHHVAGVPEDSVTAYMLWDLAAAGGHRNAGEQRDDLARRMTARQIDEAQRLSRNWHPGMALP